MKTHRLLLLAVAAIALAACSDEQPAGNRRVPINLGACINPQTRTVANPTQETALATGETVYVWANEEATSGTPDWTQNAYLRAWTLTAGAGGSLSGTTQYYPESTTLSMVAIHGNFNFTEGTDAYPGTVEHTVAADQNAAGGYECSDLMMWQTAGQGTTTSQLTVTLGHKLSKIEITLVPSGEYTADDLDRATVTVCNVVPTVSMNLADGSISTAYGTPINITPRKTGKVDFEAIVPPQSKPLNMIQVNLGGNIIKVDAQVTEFAANTRYPYDLTLNYRDIRKNPLWYVAEYNVNYTPASGTAWDNGAGTFSWATTPDEGYYFSWADAMKAFTTTANASAATPSSLTNCYLGTGSVFSGWHLPTSYEWNAIAPILHENGARTHLHDLVTVGNDVIYSATTDVCFGYSPETMGGTGTYMTEKSYWYRPADNIWYAIRYCDSEFCSAWKYELIPADATDNINPAQLTISSTLLGKSYSTSEAQSQFGTDDAKWAAIYFGNNENIGAVQRVFFGCGSRGTGSGSGSAYTVSYGASSAYWATHSYASDRAWSFGISKGTGAYNIHLAGTYKTGGYNVRLFKDCKIVEPVLGDKFFSDGTWGDNPHEDGATVIGIVAWLGNDSELKCGKSHGLVMALNDCSTTQTWGPKTVDETFLTNTSTIAGCTDNNKNGLTNTNSLIADAHTHNAASDAAGYTPAAPSTNSNTGWFLPSAAQWIAVLGPSGIGGYTGTFAWWNYSSSSTDVFNNVNSNLAATDVGGNALTYGYYWSSTEYNTEHAIVLQFDSSNGFSVKYNYKDYPRNTRPFLAF